MFLAKVCICTIHIVPDSYRGGSIWGGEEGHYMGPAVGDAPDGLGVVHDDDDVQRARVPDGLLGVCTGDLPHSGLPIPGRASILGGVGRGLGQTKGHCVEGGTGVVSVVGPDVVEKQGPGQGQGIGAHFLLWTRRGWWTGKRVKGANDEVLVDAVRDGLVVGAAEDVGGVACEVVEVDDLLTASQ